MGLPARRGRRRRGRPRRGGRLAPAEAAPCAVVIGTAGHVDHGKTALVKALTGIDTDRLQEERRRGITIELGFAHLALPGGAVAGVVDVPGHERFVRSMAAGAGGLDLVVLVVAADEGVMPQTREHLDICRLLGVPRGLIAVTKSDLLPELGADWLPLLDEEIRAAVEGTFLEEAPIVPCSSRDRRGAAGAARHAWRRLAAEVPPRPADGPLLLPIDRAFSLARLRHGGHRHAPLRHRSARARRWRSARPPPGVEALRVRSVQVHGAAVPRALAGQRTAVNLPGVEPSRHPARPGARPGRGGARLAPGSTSRSRCWPPPTGRSSTAPGSCSTSAPPRCRRRWPCSTGPSCLPGATALAQLRLGAPVATLPGQRFILRGFAKLDGRGTTLAGGRVLSIASPRRRRGRPETAAQLAALAGGDLAEARLEAVLAMAGPAGLPLEALAGRMALLAPRAWRRRCSGSAPAASALLTDRERRTWVSGAVAADLSARLVAAVEAHHVREPLAAGMGREALRGVLPPVADVRLFTRLLARLGEAGTLVAEGDLVRRAGHRAAAAGGAGSAGKAKVAAVLQAAGLTPPRIQELPGAGRHRPPTSRRRS